MTSTPDTNDSGDEHLRLIRKAAQGDPEAFCALYEALLPHILRFLAANNGHGSPEDLFQEIVGRFWQGQAKFRGGSTVLTFVLGIAANVLREHEAARQRSPEQAYPPQVVREYMDRESLAIFQAQNGEEPEGWLKKLLVTLPPKQWEAVDLVYYQGLTVAQAARKEGCSRGVFDNWLHRAIRNLKKKAMFLKALP